MYFSLGKIQVFGAACIALAVMGLSAAAHAGCTLAAVSVMPAAIRQGEFLVDAEINGKPVSLVVDTGAEITILDRAAAGRLGVGLAQMNDDIHGFGGVNHVYRGRADMTFGGLSARGIDLMASDIFPSGPNKVPDGLLGMSLMAAYDIDLDVPGNHIVLYEAKGSCRKPTVALRPELYTVPLEPVSFDVQAMIMVTVDGRRFKAQLDTGATHTIMYRKAANRLGVDMQGLRAPGHLTIRGVGTLPVPAMKHAFSTVAFGDLQINNMSMYIIDQHDDGLDRSHVGSRLGGDEIDEPGGADIVIGSDFMQKVHLWISHSSHTLIMQYPPLPSLLPN